MSAESEFMRTAAARLRDVAIRAPEVAKTLSQIADELDTEAAKSEKYADEASTP